MALQPTRRCSNKVIYSCLVAVGVILFLFGIIFGVAVRAKIHDTIKTTGQVCGKDSDAYDSWRTNTGKDDAHKYKMYYGFNATNAAAYLSQTSAVNLSLNAVGPYAMRQYDSFYNISFSKDNTEVTYKTFSKFEFDQSKSCKDCHNTDYFTGVNPGMLTLMSAASSELVIGLLVSAGDLNYPKGVCNTTTIPYSMAKSCDVNTDPMCCCDIANTTDSYGCVVRASGLYSTLAKFDNGIDMVSPLLRKQITSPMFIRKNVHEFGYGYPSGLLGLLMAGLNPSGVPDLAAFTDLMVRACNYSDQGISPSIEALAGTPYQYLGLVTCSPIAASKYWADTPAGFPASRCNVVNQATGSTNACQCVNPNHGDGGFTTVAKPCCTRKGLGCLYKVKGYISDSLYLTQEASEFMYPNDGTTQYTGCGKSDGEAFGWTKYEQKTQTPGWAQMSRQPNQSPTQLDVATLNKNPTLISFMSPVRGADGTRFKATGVTSGITSDQLSDGSGDATHDVYITQVYRSTTLNMRGETDFKGVKTLRYEPIKGFMSNTSKALPLDMPNFQVGAATPFDGVQDSTFMYGFPVYVSLPMFKDGAANAIHQVPTKCASMETQPTSCSGLDIKMNGEPVDPTSTKFDTYLLVEPASGMTISGHKRMMASFKVYPCSSQYEGCDPTKSLSLANVLNPLFPGNVVIPQYYMDETAEATDDQLDKIKMVMALNHSAGVILIVLPLIGALLAIMSGYLLYAYRNASKSSVIQTSLMSDRD